MNVDRRRQGVVLVAVLFFALLLVSSIATFVARATVDSMISRNRDYPIHLSWRRSTSLPVRSRVISSIICGYVTGASTSPWQMFRAKA